MKINLSKQWLAKRAAGEQMADVSAGFFNLGMLESTSKPGDKEPASSQSNIPINT